MLLKTEIFVYSEDAARLEELGIEINQKDWELQKVVFNLGKELEFFTRCAEIEVDGKLLTSLYLTDLEKPVIVNKEYEEFIKILGFNK
jgi:hypothetical protein